MLAQLDPFANAQPDNRYAAIAGRVMGYSLLGIVAGLAFGIVCDVRSIAWLSATGFVVSAGSLLLLLASIFYVVLFRFQWRLLELCITLIAGTIPLGIVIKSFGITTTQMGTPEIICMVLYGIVGLIVSFTASVIGMSWTFRLRENRTTHRLALILLGWMTLVAIPVTGVGAILLVVILLDHTPGRSDYYRACVLCLSSAVCLIPVIKIERVCKRVTSKH